MSGRRDERGAVALTVSILILPILLLAAFALDLGNTYAQARAFSTGSDSAALAVVGSFRAKLQSNPAYYSGGSPARSTCSDIRLRGQADADAVARTQVRGNRPFTVPIPDSSITTVMTCTPNGQLLVDVTVTQAVKTTLGNLAGVDSLTASKSAKAALGGAKAVTGVRPIGVCEFQADEIIKSGVANPANPAAQLIELDKVWQGGNDCTGDNSGAGNWGWLYCGSNGAAKLTTYIENGCPGNVIDLTASPVTMEGTTGNKGSSNNVDDAMLTLMGKTITVPVYSSVSYNGSNATYQVEGFLQVKVCGYDGKKGTMTSPGCYDGAVGVGNDEIQVRYAGFITAAELAKQICGVGTSDCGTVLATALVG